MQELLYRVPKGEELTDLELDDNFRRLRAAINALEAAISVSTDGNPVGTLLQYAPSTLPTGYLWANGQAVSRATYSALFTAIGETYGIGDGVSTFNLPDFRGRIAIGTNPMGGSTDGTLSTRTLGVKYGAESVTIPHSHTGSLSIDNHTVSITPSGSVAVNNFVGTAPVSVSVTIGTTNISYTPTGVVTIGDTEILYTPSGTVSVSLDNGAVTGTGDVTIDGAICRQFIDTPSEATAIDCTSPLTASISSLAAGLTTDVTVTSATFAGDEADLTHTHNALFTGDATNFNHTHTASASAGSATLNHGHTATFTGALATQTLTHTGTVTIDSESPSAAIIPPSLGINFIIKY